MIGCLVNSAMILTIDTAYSRSVNSFVFMKKASLLIIGVLFLVFIYYFYYHKIQSNHKLTSPFISSGKNSFNLWLPKILGVNHQVDLTSKISAQAFYFVEATSGDTLFEKNPHQRLPIASLSKIMTAIIVLEHKDWQDEILISQRATDMEPDKMLLIAGEEISVEELLYGVFLVSANDAAEGLAESSTGNRDQFITLMNAKAKQLGMHNSLFANPTGLDEDPSAELEQVQYSTAYDVALMSRYLIKNFPHILDITSTYHKFIPATYKHQDYDMYSGINLLTTYDGIIGLKTGFTPLSGYTLVTVAKRGDKIVLGVLLNSDSRRDEAKTLLDLSFKKLDI